ncbi:MAG: 6-carboxytetrahydropterin synthase [Pseudomonadota bacterium]
MSFSLSVREHVMIAHSLAGDVFGPAQRLHGATYVVTASFFASSLDEHSLVIDIGIAHEALKKVLEPLSYQNLDELPVFAGKVTTTEFLAQWIHNQLAAKIHELNVTGVSELAIELRESHVAWAEYRAPLA